MWPQLIKNLGVRCSSNECTWQGKVEGLQRHVQACALQITECAFEGCTFTARRCDLPLHYAEQALAHAETTKSIIEELRCACVLHVPECLCKSMRPLIECQHFAC
jgi:hypothetical protein